jgi:hypothetical protein
MVSPIGIPAAKPATSPETIKAKRTLSFHRHKILLTITERTTGFNKIINLPPIYFFI